MRRLLLPALLFWLGFAPAPGLALPEADLGVTIGDSPDPVSVGGTLLYTLTVTSYGSADASGVQLIDVLPEHVEVRSVEVFKSSIFSDGFEGGSLAAWSAVDTPCGVAGRIVTCALGVLEEDDDLTVLIEVEVLAGAAGQLTNTAAVGSSNPDPQSGNDSDVEVTRIAAAHADLALSISDSPDPVAIGANLVYTLTIRNLGPNTAAGIVLQDALPPEVSYVSSPGCSYAPAQGLVTCGFAELAAGASVNVILTVRVGSGAVFAITNSAAVTSTSTDGNPGNDQDTETTSIVR